MNHINILEVDINKIKRNIKILKNKSNGKFLAVVKADAYGLGAAEISKRIENDVDGFCVARLKEAIELRENNITKDILVLGYIHPDNYYLLDKYNIITTIYDYDLAKNLDDLGLNIRAHIKIETGHNRLGFSVCDKSIEEIKKINKFKNIKIEGIFSHLAKADEEDRQYTYNQVEKFKHVLDNLSDISKDWMKHIENDACLIAYNYNFDAVRSGISMYGVYPSEYIKDKYSIGLEYAFSLKSKISFIKELEKGESISYGGTYTTDKTTKVGTVSIGYADGYSRQISNKGYVLINGKKAKVLGVITMDQLMVDITDIDCEIHDEVILVGSSMDEEISPYKVAKWSDTITYEVMTSISKRVKRIYIYDK